MPKLIDPGTGRTVIVSHAGAKVLVGEHGYTDPSAPVQEPEQGSGQRPSFKELREDAKAWGISAGGSREELGARLVEHRAGVALELGEHDEDELRELAVAHDVQVDGLGRDGIIAALVAGHIAWHE